MSVRAATGLEGALGALTGIDPVGAKSLLEQIMYPFQLRFVRDEARMTAWESSRQIGKSFTIAWKAVLKAAGTARRHQNLFAASERQALEVLDKAALHLTLLERVTRKSLMRGAPSKHEIELINGSKIRAFPANPRTARGVSGDIFVDEAAHVPNDRAFWTAVAPIITRAGFSATLTSTPLGDDGLFYDVIHPAENAEYRFSTHRTTIYDAISEGLDVDVRMIRASMDEDSFAQEFLCAYLSISMSMFPWPLLKSHIVNDKVDADLHAQLLLGRSIPTFIGVDIGRRKDLTSITLGYEFPDGQLFLQPAISMRDARFEDQRGAIKSLIRKHNVQAARIDATGIGMQLAEELSEEFPGVVEGVDFSAGGEKNRLVTTAKVALERDAVWFASEDGATLADWHKIRRLVTAHGNIVFDAPRDKTGHADHFWSGALCLDASGRARGWELPGTQREPSEPASGWGLDVSSTSTSSPLRIGTAAEFGFESVDEDDLEDLRDLLSTDRPPGALPPFRGSRPPKCQVPEVATAYLLARQEDPCWGCDMSRAICEGRPRQEGWSTPEVLSKPRAEVGDTLKSLVISQGHVPRNCQLDGRELWTITSDDGDPCATCTRPRVVCGGRPYGGPLVRSAG